MTARLIAPKDPAQLATLRRTIAAAAPHAQAFAPPIPWGIGPLDQALGGGLPAGRLVDLSGTGAMSLALRVLAAANRRGLCPRYFAEAAGGRSGEQFRTDDLQFALQYITTLSGRCRATYEIWDREEQRVTWVASRGYEAPRKE